MLVWHLSSTLSVTRSYRDVTQTCQYHVASGSL